MAVVMKTIVAVFMLAIMKTMRCMALVILIMVFSLQLNAKELLTIVINKGSDNPTSIAVSPFQWNLSDNVNFDIAEVISENLKLSGLFSTLGTQDMLSQPQKAEDVYIKDWQRLGVQYLVIGEVHKSKANNAYIKVNYSLLDISNGKTLLEGVTEGRFLDAIANEVSDLIYERLTGVKGFFSTKLVYITTVDGNDGELLFRLQEADANGRNVKTLLTSGSPIMSPAWSPDGKKLAYVSFQNGRSNIYVQDRRTGSQTLISNFMGINSAPDWSPDGTKLALVLSKDGNPEIYIMDMSNRELTRLTNNYAIDTEPRWTPDGKAIVFTSNRGGGPQIYRMNMSDKKVMRLTFEGKYNARGQITENGEHLVFVHQAKNKQFHIAAMNLKTGLMHSLTKTQLDESPSIAPNGSMIVYATQSGEQRVLRMVTIDGAVEMEVPARQGQLREPAWSPFF